VYENAEPESKNVICFFLDVQHDLHKCLATRTVVPLDLIRSAKEDSKKLCPGYKRNKMDNLPPVIYATEIKPEWLDYNNHMNVAYYVLIYDLAFEELLRSLGLGGEQAKTTGISTMALESHITYKQEVSLGQDVEIRMQLVDHDHKRMHLYSEMFVKGTCGYLASTLEQISMCVDLNKRKSASFPAEVMEKIKILSEQQSHLQRPDNIGRIIGIRK
jgi:acyl-CoA thioester hydrolase